LWQEYSRDILLLGPYSKAGCLCGFLNLVAYITPNGVGNFGERESGYLHHSAHLPFRLVDTSRYL
jgi:hypothetical protein